MKYKKLPGTDIHVSIICLGTMTWGQQNTEEEAHAQLDYAVANNVNFIDTAEVYPVPPTPEKQGTTERHLGTWLKKSGKRNDLIIASKVSPAEVIRTRSYEGSYPRLNRANILSAIDGSLERLQTDYLDIYQVHWPDRKTNFFGPRGLTLFRKFAKRYLRPYPIPAEMIHAMMICDDHEQFVGLLDEAFLPAADWAV